MATPPPPPKSVWGFLFAVVGFVTFVSLAAFFQWPFLIPAFGSIMVGVAVDAVINSRRER